MSFKLVFVGDYESHDHIREQSEKMKLCIEEAVTKKGYFLLGKSPFPEGRKHLVFHFEPFDLEGESSEVVDRICTVIDKQIEANPGYHAAIYSCHDSVEYARSLENINLHIEKVRSIIRDKDEQITREEVARASDLLKMVNMVYENKKDISILDFGGETGLHYASLLTKKPEDAKISYTLIDLPNVAVLSNRYWRKELGDKNISVMDSIPFSLPNDIDIVYARSSIQYFGSYPGDYLQRLIDINPKYIGIFQSYCCKEDVTHLTTQRFPVQYMIPYWVYNQQQIIDLMEENGYKKIHHEDKTGAHIFKINGQDRSNDRYLTDFIFERGD